MRSQPIFFVFTLLFICITHRSIGQSIDNITVEKEGELVAIRYKIINSDTTQIFRINVFAVINGKQKFELKLVSGDVGKNVVGGKKEYMIVWDALKEIDEVSSAEFIIGCEVVKDKVSNSGNHYPLFWSSRRFFVIPTLHEGHGILYGLRLSYMGSWGCSLRYTVGIYHDHILGDISAFHSSLDLTKRIVNINGFQIYLLAGPSFAQEPAGYSGDAQFIDTYFGIEFGSILAIKRFALCIALSYFNPNMSDGIELVKNNFANLGLGIRF
jgi:hypothetical protein